MDMRKIQRLIEILQASDVTEIEVSTGEERIRISRGTPNVPLASIAPMYSGMPAPQVASLPGSASTPTPGAGNAGQAGEPTGHVIKSPMVGTFYRAPAPDARAFVEEGDTIKVGQTLCLIEAMKLLNEIESDVGGRVLKVLVENGQPVEYGEPLFIVDTSV